MNDSSSTHPPPLFNNTSSLAIETRNVLPLFATSFPTVTQAKRKRNSSESRNVDDAWQHSHKSYKEEVEEEESFSDRSSSDSSGDNVVNDRKRRKHKKQHKKKHKKKKKKKKKQRSSAHDDYEKVVKAERKVERLDKHHWLNSEQQRIREANYAVDSVYFFDNGDHVSRYGGDVKPDKLVYNRVSDSAFILGTSFTSHLAQSLLGNDRQSVVMGGHRHRRVDRYFSEKHSLRERDRHAKRIRINSVSPSDTKWTHNEDFIRCATADDDREVGATIDEVHLGRVRYFNTVTREQPKNVNLWMDFVRFQDDGAHRSSKGGIIEKKIAILERALEHNSDNEDLLLLYMSLCEQAVEPQKVSDLWHEVVLKHTTKCRIWDAYFAYFQSQFSKFNVDECRQVYRDSLLRLSSQLNSVHVHDVESAMLHVFSKLCTFEVSTGYVERAVALFQALVEYNLCRPTETVMSLEAFQEYWESDSPCIGEMNSKTWLYWQQTRGHQVPTSSSGGVADTEQSPLSTKIWIDAELGEHAWLPLRDIAQGALCNESNPDVLNRVVLWNDIEPFLFTVSDEGLRMRLVHAFVDMLSELTRCEWNGGICPLALPIASQRYALDLCGEYHTEIWRALWDMQRICGCDSGVLMSSNDSVHNVHQLDAFANSLWCSTDVSTSSSDRGGGDDTAMRDIVKFQCRMIDSLPLHYSQASVLLRARRVSLQCRLSFDEARVVSQRFIKHDEYNVLLYYVHAKLEQSCGHLRQARNIYQVALSLTDHLSADQAHFVPFMWWSLVELELSSTLVHVSGEHCGISEEHKRTLLNVLCCRVEGCTLDEKSPSNTRIVRARQMYQSVLGELSRSHTLNNEELDFTPPSPYACTVMCWAWFEYLCRGIDGVSDVYQQYVFDRSSGGGEFVVGEFEWLLMHRVRLTLLHSYYYGMAPRKLRHTVNQALQEFPSNLWLLRVYVLVEQRCKLMWRIRRHFDTLVSRGSGSSANLSPIVWLIGMAMERSSGHRLVQFFERLVCDFPTVRNCVVIWKFCIKALVLRGDLHSAQQLFYRAIAQCPFSKSLWLESVQMLHDTISHESMLQILQLLDEKEIRLHAMPASIPDRAT